MNNKPSSYQYVNLFFYLLLLACPMVLCLLFLVYLWGAYFTNCTG